MENSLMQISYKLQKTQCNSKLFVIIYYVIKLLFGLPIVLIKKIGNEAINNQVFQILVKWTSLQDILTLNNLILIDLGIITILLAHLILFIRLIKKQQQNQLQIQIALYLTILIEATSFGIIFVSWTFFQKGLFYQSSELIGLNIFIILYVIIIKIFFTELHISFSFLRNNMFSKMHNKSAPLSEAIRFISITILAFIDQNSEAFQKLTLVLLVIGLSLRLNSFLWNYQYPNQFMGNFTCFYVSFEASMSFLLFINSIIDTQILAMNFGILVAILTLFLYYGLYCFRKYRINEITFRKVSELKNQQNAIIFLGILYSFSLPSKSDDEILQLISLLKFHTLNCDKSDCYCRKQKIIPSNLSKDLVSNFISDKIKQVEQTFSKSIKVLSVSGLFKLQAFENYPLLISFIKKLTQNKDNIDFKQRLIKFCLNKQIITLIKQKNIKNQVILIHLVEKLELLLNQVITDVKRTALIKSKKNAYLSKKLCRITELQLFCDEQLSLMSKVSKNYQTHVKLFKRSKQFNSIFNFYFQFVFLLKPMLTQIKKNQISSTLKASEIIDAKSLEKSMFTNDVCLFQSSANPKQIGKILNVSKNVINFGYSKNSLLNQRIQTILPQSVRSQHEILIHNWLQFGRWDSIGKLKKSFLVTQNGNLCQVLMYLKILYTIKDQIIILVLIYKKNEEDYIYFNQKLQIMEMGIKIEEVLALKRQNTPGRLIFPEINKIFKSASKQQKSTHTQALSMESIQSNSIMQYKQMAKKQKRSSTILNSTFKTQIFKKQINHFNVRINYQLISVGRCQNLVLQITDISKKIKDKGISSIQLKGSYQIKKVGSMQNQVHSIQSLSKKQISSQLKPQEVQRINAVNSSVGSSADNQIHVLNRIISNFLQTYFNPKEITFNRLTSMTVLIVFAMTFLLLIIIGSFYIYSIGLFSVSQIMFADGAVSDSMQLSQFIYNNLLMIKARTMADSSIQEINSIIKSSIEIQNYLFNLIVEETQFLFKNVTSLKKIPYYEYLQQDQKLTFSQATRVAQIDTNQFLQFFVHSSLTGLQYPSEFNSSLKRITNNFPQLKRINHYNLKKYYQFALSNIQILQMVFYLSLSIFGIVGIVIGITLWRYFYFKYIQKINFFDNYKLINHNQFQTLSKYYNSLIMFLQMYSPAKKNGNQQNLNLQIDDSKNAGSSKLKIVNNKKFIDFVWIIALVLGLNIPNIAFNFEIRKFFNLSKQMIASVNHLMDSENYLLQAYFDLKGYYLVDNQEMDLNPFLDSLLLFMRQDQSIFNQIVSSQIKLFSSFDDTYEEEFINLLIKDLCDVVEQNISLFQAQKCKNQLRLKIVESGLIISMNFFQREILSSIYQLKKGGTQNMTYFFNQDRFKEIDQSIIYMFKMYQILQQRVLVSLNSVITSSLTIAQNFIIVQCIFLLVFMIIWVFSINYQKKNLAQIYGYFLTIPMKILKENKHVIYHTERILEIRN